MHYKIILSTLMFFVFVQLIVDDDPVMFTSATSGGGNPGSNHNMQTLDLGKTKSPSSRMEKLMPSSRNNNNSGGSGGGSGGYGSGRNNGSRPETKEVFKNTGNNVTGYSPMPSARGGGNGGGSGRLTPAQTRSARERMEEITLVRQLGV
jgi:hypothetical protein